MKEWLTAAEIAEMDLPGFPATESAVIRWAKKNEIDNRYPDKVRERAGRGGGVERHYTVLPEGLRQIIRLRAIKAEPAPPAPEIFEGVEVPEVPEGRESAALRRDAILCLLRFWDIYRKGQTGPVEVLRHHFVQLYRNDKLSGLPAWVTAALTTEGGRRRGLCLNTLRRWERLREKGEVVALAGRYGNRKGTGLLDTDEEMNAFVVGMLAEWPHVASSTVYEGLQARFKDRSIPNLRSLQRFMKRWKTENAQLFERARNPDAWRSKYKAASGSRSEGVTSLNQLWEMDSTPADLILADGKRHALIGVIDVYSRRFRLLVSRSSNSAAIAATFRGAVMAWGVPETVKIDNGADYISHHMTRAYAALGVLTDICPPFTPEAKPHVERAFQTFSHGLFELLPGFVGHNVGDRKAIEARRSFAQRMMTRGATVDVRMQPDELQAFCDKWCEDLYQHREHGGLNGQTPFQVASSWRAPVRRIDNDRALDILLSPTSDDGWRTVTKKGLRIDGASFDHANLGGLEGRQVRVLFDEADFGHVYVFDEDGAFVCKAVCPERTGVSRREVAAARKARQNQVMKDGMAALRAAKRQARTQDVVGEIMAAKAEAAGKLLHFPPASETHTTPALDEAARAARLPSDPPPARSQAERERHLALVEELKAAPPPRDERAEKRARIERALEIERRLDAGDPVDADDARWFRGYRDHPEFTTQKQMLADFGRMVI